jgi:hypothetical protein
MLEVMNDNNFEEQPEATNEKDQQENKEFKLPKIDRIPSRGSAQAQEIKSSTKLPNLKSENGGEA